MLIDDNSAVVAAWLFLSNCWSVSVPLKKDRRCSGSSLRTTLIRFKHNETFQSVERFWSLLCGMIGALCLTGNSPHCAKVLLPLQHGQVRPAAAAAAP